MKTREMEPNAFYDSGLSKRKILDSLLVVDLPRQKGMLAFKYLNLNEFLFYRNQVKRGLNILAI